MLPPRPYRRRLAAAVGIVLAATAGAGMLTAPAHAAPPAAVAASTAEAPIPFPRNADLVGAGNTHFLTFNPASGIYGVKSYKDGTGMGYDGRVELRSTRTDDYVIHVGHSSVQQRNVDASGPIQIPLGVTNTGTYTYAGSAADAVFTSVETETGTVLRKHVKTAPATYSTDVVTGFPEGAIWMSVAPATHDHALVTFTDRTGPKWGLLDLATGTVGDIHARTPGAANGDVAVSETHVAWAEGDGTTNPKVFVLDRATDQVREIPLPDRQADGLQVGLLAGWVVYGEPGGLASGTTNPLHSVTAYSLTDPAAAPVELLDHLTSSVAAPDGSLYVRGGLVGQGEGMYRIAATGGAQPEATLVATTGEPTEVVIGAGGPPAVVDLDKNGGKISFAWDFSRTSVDVKVTLRHVRTGKTSHMYETHPDGTTVPFTWDGTAGSPYEGAPNGAYTWQVEAKPLNGIGPTATASGGFTVTRAVRPHDFNDNAGLDLLSRDASGRLWRQDSHYSPYANDGQIIDVDAPVSIGSGWQVYDRIEAVGNLAGSAVGDLLARDRDGVLWLYQGNGTGGFATRVRVGGGWQTYDKITGGSDLTGDGRADVLATDRTGVLWLYKSTGNATNPFATRQRIGAGWGGYTKLAATGNIGGAAAGDLVARDKDGVLWLYLGKGDGTFAPRTRVGSGWNTYTHIVAVGDSTGDGRADLVGLSPGGNWLYKGTGSWSAPFKGRELMGQTIPVNASQLVF
ncbi:MULTISPECIES: FG-GAP repeat domain-containing protein [Streptomyces]|uniref:VCBS repeat-containing protein n=2 Tax=Streptomyces TaxID=1883 RepID=A0ABU4KDV8_9ACTN|nr:VCBS repeat-containing protein [Streptomyces roseolus]MDX2295950.1 VCBS repeat-containing protein [Streptomyces roseolus]